MKTVQVADYQMDKAKDHGVTLKDFATLNMGEPTGNDAYVHYDPREELVDFEPDDPQLAVHNRIRTWLRAVGYTDDMGEILIYVWW